MYMSQSKKKNKKFPDFGIFIPIRFPNVITKTKINIKKNEGQG